MWWNRRLKCWNCSTVFLEYNNNCRNLFSYLRMLKPSLHWYLIQTFSFTRWKLLKSGKNHIYNPYFLSKQLKLYKKKGSLLTCYDQLRLNQQKKLEHIYVQRNVQWNAIVQLNVVQNQRFKKRFLTIFGRFWCSESYQTIALVQ
jgi:hypothetical protein